MSHQSLLITVAGEQCNCIIQLTCIQKYVATLCNITCTGISIITSTPIRNCAYLMSKLCVQFNSMHPKKKKKKRPTNREASFICKQLCFCVCELVFIQSFCFRLHIRFYTHHFHSSCSSLALTANLPFSPSPDLILSFPPSDTSICVSSHWTVCDNVCVWADSSVERPHTSMKRDSWLWKHPL